eukprot:212974-Alexandrium_andersonii.AAC.1
MAVGKGREGSRPPPKASGMGSRTVPHAGWSLRRLRGFRKGLISGILQTRRRQTTLGFHFFAMP